MDTQTSHSLDTIPSANMPSQDLVARPLLEPEVAECLRKARELLAARRANCERLGLESGITTTVGLVTNPSGDDLLPSEDGDVHSKGSGAGSTSVNNANVMNTKWTALISKGTRPVKVNNGQPRATVLPKEPHK